MSDIMQTLYSMRYQAVARADELKEIFEPTDYKWILGMRVIKDIQANLLYKFTFTDIVEPTMLGIPIEADKRNPDRLELWKNITKQIS